MDYPDQKELSCCLHIYDLKLLKPTLKIVTIQDVCDSTDHTIQEPSHWYAWLEFRSKDAVFDHGLGHSFIIKGRYIGSLMQIIKGKKTMVFDQISKGN